MNLKSNLNFKGKFDLGSINFKLIMVFTFFTLFVVGLIWLLQILFLNSFYQDRKASEVNNFATDMRNVYSIDKREGWKIAKDFADGTDVDVTIEDKKGVLFTPSGSHKRVIETINLDFVDIKRKLADSELNEINYIYEDENNEKTLILAYYLTKPGDEQADESDDILYVIAPLYPLESTIEILKSQLVYMSLFTFLGAILIAFLISRFIAKPLEKLTKNARKMGDGNYEIKFEGGYYSEINELADSLNLAVSKLDKADKYQKDLIANVSHDLKTPLTMVKSYAELIRDISGDNREKRNNHLNIIIDETERLSTLVSDMLDLSAININKATLKREYFNLSAGLEALKPQCDLLSDKGDYVFNWDVEKEIYMYGDKSKIKRSMYNLINNAIKYCGDDKYIEVRLKRKGNNARFEVKDNGKGIPLNEQEDVWSRFFKSSMHHRRPVAGTGLGLPIVKEIIQLHKGKFGLISDVDKGSLFWFEIPLSLGVEITSPEQYEELLEKSLLREENGSPQ